MKRVRKYMIEETEDDDGKVSRRKYCLDSFDLLNESCLTDIFSFLTNGEIFTSALLINKICHKAALKAQDLCANKNAALVRACRKNDKRLFERCLSDKRVDVSIPKNTPIIEAAKAENLPFVVALLRNGADPYPTAFKAAVKTGYWEMCKEIVHHRHPPTRDVDAALCILTSCGCYTIDGWMYENETKRYETSYKYGEQTHETRRYERLSIVKLLLFRNKFPSDMLDDHIKAAAEQIHMHGEKYDVPAQECLREVADLLRTYQRKSLWQSPSQSVNK